MFSEKTPGLILRGFVLNLFLVFLLDFFSHSPISLNILPVTLLTTFYVKMIYYPGQGKSFLLYPYLSSKTKIKNPSKKLSKIAPLFQRSQRFLFCVFLFRKSISFITEGHTFACFLANFPSVQKYSL